jgi:hypothetical protein
MEDSHSLTDSDRFAFLENLAREVARILTRSMNPKDLMQLLQIIHLGVKETALLLRVKEKTIREWVSQDKIPYRKANGKVLFLLIEILEWTLPENDRFANRRLNTSAHCSIANEWLAATWERKP